MKVCRIVVLIDGLSLIVVCFVGNSGSCETKLMPCLEEADATMRMVDIVKYNSNTWRHSVSDITHQIFQMDF